MTSWLGNLVQYSDSDEDEERSEQTHTLSRPVGDSMPLARNDVENNLKRKHGEQEEDLLEM